jgi:FlaA1/EpsC-like NDP-sugar epimerase
MRNLLFKFRNRYFFFFDFLIFVSVPFLAFAIRFEGFNYPINDNYVLLYAAIFAFIKIGILFFVGIYGRYWDHASVDDLLLILYSGINILLIQFFFLFVLKQFPIELFTKIPFSVSILDTIFSVFFVAISRLSLRILTRTYQRFDQFSDNKSQRAIIVGAGTAGIMVLEELQRNVTSNTRIIGFIDDDAKKVGLKIRGVKVLGGRSDIPEVVITNHIKRIIIAIPSAAGNEIKEIINISARIPKIEILTVPPLYDIIDGKVEVNKLRKVQIEDLLRRDPIKTDIESIFYLLRDKNILVTGAGGSIGSEICRQILRCRPANLLLLGHGENSIFEVENELLHDYPRIRINSFIADITDKQRLRNIFNHNKVDYIFHAAAHKHVPLMEAHPYEAIKNNVLGTKTLVDIAVEFNVEKFIMISTDKAVNPTNIMGASKRTAEMVVINYAKKFNKKFSVVRFGNVLGSRGSVVRTFKSQIEKGGPITITHPEIKRFFMTIPEAVQLVLQAFILGNGGDIFVLDMGKPIRIIDLAEDLIRLSGLKVHDDIEFHVTGLRPGEKLFEELFIEGETYKKTANDKIFLAENASQFITNGFNEKLEELLDLLKGEKKSNLEYRSFLKTIVPEYTPQENNN